MFWPFIEVDNELSYCPLADFGALHVCEGKDLYAKAVVAQPLMDHLTLHNAALVSGKIVVMERGVCDFVTKMRHAQDAGAIAVIVANTKNEDDPNAAFVMDAGSTRRRDELALIHIPAVMVSHAKAAVVFDHVRRCYLDRHEFALTIKFLGAHAAKQVMETIETTAKQKAQRELAEKGKEEMEKQQIEATKQLRSRLYQQQQSSSRSSTTLSTPSSTPRASPKRSEERKPRSAAALLPPSSREASLIESSYETSVESRSVCSDSSSSGSSCYSSSCCSDNQVSIAIRGRDERSRSEVVTNHWCPMTTALLQSFTSEPFLV